MIKHIFNNVRAGYKNYEFHISFYPKQINFPSTEKLAGISNIPYMVYEATSTLNQDDDILMFVKDSADSVEFGSIQLEKPP